MILTKRGDMVYNNNKIYADNNDYGYRFNLNHPRIRELYERYKRNKGYASTYPLSDEERAEFEMYLQQSIDRQKEKKQRRQKE